MHKPIFLEDISLSFKNKTCFENFSNHIYPGSRIAIIGRNGNGKSSLLNILLKKLSPSTGEVIIPDDLNIGYVEQTITDFNELSGGQRLNKRLSEVLANSPDLLLLDEPTNHLDKENRKSLINMLKRYQGTLIIVSHDTELLQNCVDYLWHIDNNKIHEFFGSYNDYLIENKRKKSSIEKELSSLKREKKDIHNSLMKEQERAKKSKAHGEKKYANDKLALRAAQGRGQMTSNKNNKFINNKKGNLIEQLSELYIPEVILPKFSLTTENIKSGNILSISSADIGYDNNMILKNINLSLSGKERIAICGKNASGKSTLLKAILSHDKVIVNGDLYLPKSEYIGYLDQHYSNLNPQFSVIEHLYELRPDWNEHETRKHLNDFLFRKNSDIEKLAINLSGGEKARLSLSLIAAKTPKLLILDEITNNLDLETKEHIIQVIKLYPGAIIIVSHEEDFLKNIGIDRFYLISDAKINEFNT